MSDECSYDPARDWTARESPAPVRKWTAELTPRTMERLRRRPDDDWKDSILIQLDPPAAEAPTEAPRPKKAPVQNELHLEYQQALALMDEKALMTEWFKLDATARKAPTDAQRVEQRLAVVQLTMRSRGLKVPRRRW